VICEYFVGFDKLFDAAGAGCKKHCRNSGHALRRIPRATIMIRISFKTLSLLLAALACLLSSPASADQITYQMVTVGNPGNANDTGGSHIGSVAYSYQIGKYSVTIGQYTTFLNAADPNGTNPHDIYNLLMGTDLNVAGISYDSGAAAGAKYSVMNNGGDSVNRPITYVSWYDAARYANWMTNGQGSGSTETGAYTLNGATSGGAVAANPGAAFRLPTESEFYKAAYYSPDYGRPGVPGYYVYATQSDEAPGNIIGSGANQANYITIDGHSVTQSPEYSSSQNYLTDVGAFSGSGSYYRTFDQTGDVSNWNDLDGTAGPLRGLRGGNWYRTYEYLMSSYGVTRDPAYENHRCGFRLASPVAVPEPSTWVMGLVGIACGGWQMWRRRKQA
jgi:formylglycine-generating enzyme required for sulfatase activity